MEKPFEPDLYTDEYQTRLKAMIADNIASKEIVTPEENPSNVIDLMEALKASLEQKKPAI